MTQRLDRLLVDRALAPTRSAAQRLIDAGAVRWRPVGGSGTWRAAAKTGETVHDDCEVAIVDDAELRWVSRGGLKLDGALAALGLQVGGRTALDVGQSTGGFTDVLLARGAARVVGVDVGHGQLHPRLRDDPRVVAIEGFNARTIGVPALRAAAPGRDLPDRFDLVVGDLSFISLTLVLPALAPLLADDGDLLMLVKPQFELQPAHVGRGGLVRDPALHREVEQRIRTACAEAALAVSAWLTSPVTGGDGNTEFLVHARPAAARDSTDPSLP
jgi:23S rRNA (cytidine1920-2'-O)/16S rRNA (cytidine1409-2'-O)-methyltransferase